MEDDESSSTDICRVCRCEGSLERPLFHPCICTGSIKFIHQECLLQWLRYSKKEICELCNHRFSFTPIYSPDMPKRLPLRIFFSGLLGTIFRAVRFWLHYTMVALAWLGVVPLTACRIYRTLFTGSVSSILSLPVNVFSTENITSDILQGCAVVTLTLLAFIGLVWLREQILHGGGPEWLDMDNDLAVLQREGPPVAGAQQAAPMGPAGWIRPGALLNIGVPGAQVQGGQQVNEVNAENLIAADQVDVADHLPEEPAAPEIIEQPAAGPQGQEQNGGADEGQWPIEWDRAAEELTWERLLGLDGSLVFLEHVFWVVSLNTLFILVFAFCPYHIGHFTIVGFTLKSLISGAHFEGMLTTLCGYCVIGLSLVILHSITTFFKWKRPSRVIGLCYVVVKVALLLVMEVLAFPVICGWWLDICSLALFDATLKDRQLSYHQAPMASIFMHWLVGMVYVFYFASFVILLREVLRPGVLWFLRNLNDPDYNPIQEMIHLSIARHLRRFCASLVLFGTSILVMLYLPSRIIKRILPNFLPYQTSQATESQVDELAMELMLLMIVLPAVQDQNHTREWLKTCIRAWCSAAAWLLDLRSYLFGDLPGIVEADEEVSDDEADEVIGAEDEPGWELGEAHQALGNRDGLVGQQEYSKPKIFPLRIAGLLVLMVISWLVASLILMLVPVWLGRQAFQMWLSDNPKIYELYTAALGLYACLLSIRGFTLVSGWLQQGWIQLSQKLKEWAVIGAKAFVAVSLLIGLIPLLFGILLEMVVLMPVRVPLTQSPVFFLWQDWALGAMYTKITIALTFMGPDWWLKTAIEQLYQDGFRNLKLSFLIPNLVIPTVSALGMALALPYIFAHSLMPMVLRNPALLLMVQRRIYPFLLFLIFVVGLISMQLKQFKKLYEHIKNDRYLVGRRLVNYNHSGMKRSLSANR